MSTKIIDDLNWRYATKKFDTEKKVSEHDLDELLESLRLSASSFGIQPWKFVIVTDKATREKLREHAWGQPQITDASHLIVLCARKDVDEAHIKKYVESMASTRGVQKELLKGYEDVMLGFRNNMSDEETLQWSKKQVYIALGFLLSAAARKKIDACPMEGFDHAAFDKILGLDSHNLASTVLCPVGYRADDDHTAGAKKVRFDKEDVFVFK